MIPSFNTCVIVSDSAGDIDNNGPAQLQGTALYSPLPVPLPEYGSGFLYDLLRQARPFPWLRHEVRCRKLVRASNLTAYDRTSYSTPLSKISIPMTTKTVRAIARAVAADMASQ